jgi:hypothetical protein
VIVAIELVKTRKYNMKNLLAVAAILIASPLSAAENAIAVSSQILSTDTTRSGLSIALPHQDVHVIATILNVAPGAKLPEAKYPFSRYGYLLAGRLEVTNVRNGKIETYNPGDFIVFDYTIDGAYPWREGASGLIGSEES